MIKIALLLLLIISNQDKINSDNYSYQQPNPYQQFNNDTESRSSFGNLEGEVAT
jgi:hypothetical protein